MEGTDFAASGAVHFPGVFDKDDMAALGVELDAVLLGRPGRRLISGSWTAVLPPLTAIAAGLIGEGAFPVRAVAFDKTQDTNWAVAWHQDRTVAVRQRVDTEGFGPWSTKDGVPHVAPPVNVLRDMVTLRLHVDPCGADNAPLKVALGTHRLGAVAADQASRVANACPLRVCEAGAGDVWACSTLILHASERSRSHGRRRVLQVDFAAAPLPPGLEWLGLEQNAT
jgi:hypothetical protein